MPRGVLGRAYWYVLLPFHSLIFPRMLAKIIKAAEAAEAEEPAAASTGQRGLT